MGFLSLNARSVSVAFGTLFLRNGVASFPAGPEFLTIRPQTLAESGLLRAPCHPTENLYIRSQRSTVG